MRYVITTVINGKRKFLYRPYLRGYVAVDAVEHATVWDNIDDAAELAARARKTKMGRVFSWHEAIHPADAIGS